MAHLDSTLAQFFFRLTISNFNMRLYLMILLVPIIFLMFVFSPTVAQENSWRKVETGLEIGQFYSQQPADSAGADITIVRIHPRHFNFQLFSITADSSKPRTVNEWAEGRDLVAVINGGMFQEDHSTSVGYFKSGKHLNNGHFNRNNSLFVSSPKQSGLPPAALLDRTCDNVARVTEQYDHILQSIRMINCDRQNTWREQEQKWSMVILGQDGSGRILMIHNRIPYSVHRLIDVLLEMPIDLQKAMYLEGGAQAALYVKSGNTELKRYSRTNSSIFRDEGEAIPWPIPNVIGVRRIQKR